MAVDIERLIESLIDDVSCYGDLGCSVSHILNKVDQFYPSDAPCDALVISPHQAVWDWVRGRCDISIGHNREWNHALLSEILLLPEETPAVEDHPNSAGPGLQTQINKQEDRTALPPLNPTPRNSAATQYRPKVYVSEEQMWQSIAGHGADFKRIPKLEWAALVGIASTKKEGILQGDLCRLIGQDKRSLPRRTDSLAQKGYILKRTTLVRGVKTSKMWLSRYAPSLSSDHSEVEDGRRPQDAPSSMSPENLNRDMEPVSWRTRWTGKAIDMLSLAETVISIVKAFGIMRYHDLRQKLGILNLPWQMKVTARLCRWAVRRGILQYVGATLGDRLYKDCLKFTRDFASEDWTEWLRTGKEKARPKTDADLDAYRDNPNDDTSAKRKKNKRAAKSINVMVSWKPEKPLATTVLDAIRAADARAVTNRYLGAHTLGPPFSRYVTSISTTLATPALQPKHLAHFQVSKELMRVKKQAIYFFSLPRLHATTDTPNHEGKDTTESMLASSQGEGARLIEPVLPQNVDSYFSPLTPMEVTKGLGGLTMLSQMADSRHRVVSDKTTTRPVSPPPSGDPTTSDIGSRAGDEGSTRIVLDIGSSQAIPMVTRQTSGHSRGRRGRRTTTLVLTITVSPSSLATILSRSDLELPSNGRLIHAGHAGLPSEPQPPLTMESLDSLTSEKKEHRSRGPEVLCGSDSQTSPSGRHRKSLHSDGHDSGETFAETLGARATSAGPKDADRDDDVENPRPTLPGPAERAPTKKGRPKGPAPAASQNPRASKGGAFRCDKCGGVWRNDNGLKYHLEKSSSACNPSYTPPPPKPPRYLSARKVLLSNAHTPDSDVTVESPRRRTRNSAANAVAGGPSTQATNSTRQATRGSSAFQHAPTLRTRSQYLCPDSAGPAEDIGVGNTVQQSLNSLDSFSGSALNPFNALIRNTTATLTDVSRETPVEVTDSLVSSYNAPTLTPNPLNLPDSPSRQPLNVPEEYDDRGGLDDGRAVAVIKHNSTGPAMLLSPLEPTVRLPSLQACLDDIIPDVKQLPVLGQTPQTVPFRMPAKTDKPRTFGHRHNSQLHRSSEIIQYLLDIHGGVIPGDRSLWHALTAVWERTFSTDTPPNYGTTQGVVGKMVSKKVVRKSVHAFRDPKGSFKSVTLLLAPRVDSQSSAALEVKDKMIATHPKTYLLPGYTPASGLPDDTKWNGIPVFSTRRQLAQGVEVLDAPFYASRQVSRKRPKGVDGTEKTSRKRPKKENLKNLSVISEDETPSTRGAYRVFVGGHDAKPLHSQISGALTFLEPNTRLDEDTILLEQRLQPEHHTWPNSHGSTTSKAAILGTTDRAMEERQVTEQPRVQFVEPAVVVRDGDTWPHLRADFFERNFSASMQGRLSDVPQTHIHLPRGLSDIMGPQWSKAPPVAPETVYRFFMDQIEKCKSWETDTDRVALLVGMTSVAPNYIWINHVVNIPTCARSHRKLTWAMESPGPLPEQATECLPSPATRKGQIHSMNSSPPKRLRGDENVSRSTTAVLPMDLKTRKMTPWTGPTEDGQPLSQAPRLDSNNDAVLIAAFVATRTLLGGADKYVEWGLLLRLFPSKSLAWLRKFWSKARRDRAATINKLTERFQERFVKAYEHNELPIIDFDDYLSYDWASLVEWTLDLAGDAIKLPSSRAELDREYAMDSLTADTSDWQRIYYSFQSSTFNRLEALTSGSTCTPVDKTEAMPISTDEAELSKAKSWLRALCGTKSGTYRPADIRQKLCSITEHGDVHNNDLLGRAIAALQNQNVITKTKHRSSESGSHRFTEWFMPRFDKTSQAHKYNDAVSFKAMLDRIFMKNKPWRVPYLLQDGEVMAMINMQAAGRIKVTPVDIPHIPLGFKPGFYESRKFPKSFYNFGLEVTPTDTYIYNVDLPVLEAARQDLPPIEGPEGKLPIWSDIFGKLCADRWGQTLRAITFTVAMRGPMGVEGILAALAPFLEDFEIDLAIEWGLRNHILKKTAHGGTYTADEWWWLLAGAQYHDLLAPVGSGNQHSQVQ